MRRLSWIALAVVSCLLLAWLQRAPSLDDIGAARAPDVVLEAPRDDVPAIASDHEALPDFLPREAQDTLRRIADGGPFAHRQDGGTFQNRERRLPPRPRGWYREYTVPTPGALDRGARRIVSGGNPPTAFWYTDNHYRSFRGVACGPQASR